MIEFLEAVFKAEIVEMMTGKDGSAMHGEVKIDDSVIMMGKATEEYPPNSNMIHVYTKDIDSSYQKALELGGTSLMPPTDQYYGNRESGVRGPMGNQWWISTRVKLISVEKMKEHAAKMDR